jgi:hypothetical protein
MLIENPVTPLDGIPSYNEWIIKQGFYDFVKPN